MPQNRIKLRTMAWFGDEELELNFPQSWEVIECRMAGHDAPALSDSQMEAAFANPIGTKRIRDLAEGKREAVIIFDDVRRPTPVGKIASFVLKELKEAGMGEEQIRFVAGRANHETMDNEDLLRKLGPDILARYLVFQHNTHDQLVRAGVTSRGTEVLVNREVMRCDLKIGIGCIIPHFSAGFGGGAKIVLPGVCGLKTVAYNHMVVGAATSGKGLGIVEGNQERLDMEEAARLVGIDVVADVLVNAHRQVVGLFVGDVVEEHRAGVALARKIYATVPAPPADVVLLNSYPLDMTAFKGGWAGNASLKEEGDLVVVARSPRGQQPWHYLTGRMGTDYGGAMWKPKERPFVAKAGRVLLLADFASRYDRESLGPNHMVTWYKQWPDLLEELKAKYGQRARVAVYPCVTIQYPGGQA